MKYIGLSSRGEEKDFIFNAVSVNQLVWMIWNYCISSIRTLINVLIQLLALNNTSSDYPKKAISQKNLYNV